MKYSVHALTAGREVALSVFAERIKQQQLMGQLDDYNNGMRIAANNVLIWTDGQLGNITHAIGIERNLYNESELPENSEFYRGSLALMLAVQSEMIGTDTVIVRK